MSSIKESVDKSMRLGNREMTKDADDELDGDTQILLGTLLGSSETGNDGIVADTSGNMGLGIKEDLSMTNLLTGSSLEVLVCESFEVVLGNEHAHSEVVIVQEIVQTCESSIALSQLVGRFIDRVFWKFNAILLSKSEEKLGLKSSFNVEVLLNLGKGFEETVNSRLAHLDSLANNGGVVYYTEKRSLCCTGLITWDVVSLIVFGVFRTFFRFKCAIVTS